MEPIIYFFKRKWNFICLWKNVYGQLGLKDKIVKPQIQQVPFNKKIIQISAGFDHT